MMVEDSDEMEQSSCYIVELFYPLLKKSDSHVKSSQEQKW